MLSFKVLTVLTVLPNPFFVIGCKWLLSQKVHTCLPSSISTTSFFIIEQDKFSIHHPSIKHIQTLCYNFNNKYNSIVNCWQMFVHWLHQAILFAQGHKDHLVGLFLFFLLFVNVSLFQIMFSLCMSSLYEWIWSEYQGHWPSFDQYCTIVTNSCIL